MKVSWKNQKNMSLIYKNEVYDIIGACFDVYKELSCGLSEPIYQEALEIEFNLRGIPFEREKELVVYYKGRKLRKKYVADFVCYDDIIVELKALDNVTSKEVSQLLNYLHITKYPLGLLVNFGHEDNLEWKRYANF
jgi:GxxExxY protein